MRNIVRTSVALLYLLGWLSHLYLGLSAPEIYPYAINNRGVAYMASGHPEEALRDFDRAIQLQPRVAPGN